MIKKIYKSLSSTNVKARELLQEESLEPPYLIRAIDQYRGRGLGANFWESEAGKNITVSVVLSPAIEASSQFEISVASSLAVCDLLNLYFDDVKIKWPNDILVDEKKIAGLLIEHSVTGDLIRNTIIGIGLNVNQLDFSPDIPNPISFKMIYGKDFNLEELLELLIQFLEKRLELTNKRQFDIHREIYLKNLFRYKIIAPYKADGKWINARINDVDEFGQLILENEAGETLKFGFKEVEFID